MDQQTNEQIATPIFNNEPITEQAPVFDAETLIKAADTFGTTPEVIAGALYGIKERITMKQASELLKKFLDKPIK